MDQGPVTDAYGAEQTQVVHAMIRWLQDQRSHHAAVDRGDPSVEDQPADDLLTLLGTHDAVTPASRR